jgi:ABC-type branched-subunit amino acid transport system substrate-binding protein
MKLAPLFLFSFLVWRIESHNLKLCLVIPFDNSYRQVQMGALQAVDDVNNRATGLVRNFSIGGSDRDIIDAISDLNIEVEVTEQSTVLETYDRVENCMNNGAHAVIGPAYSSRSKVLSQYLSRKRHVPLVSFSATSPALSDNRTFPYFTRTVTADDAVAFAAINFVLQAGFVKVAFLYGEDIFGQGLHTACRQYKNQHASYLGWLSVPFPADPTKTIEIESSLQQIKDSDSLIVFFAGVSNTLPIVIEKAAELGIIGKESGYLSQSFYVR